MTPVDALSSWWMAPAGRRSARPYDPAPATRSGGFPAFLCRPSLFYAPVRPASFQYFSGSFLQFIRFISCREFLDTCHIEERFCMNRTTRTNDRYSNPRKGGSAGSDRG
ncbi:hypothetical protein ACFYWI_22870, partial [Streptomyces sp. NPDC002889]